MAKVKKVKKEPRLKAPVAPKLEAESSAEGKIEPRLEAPVQGADVEAPVNDGKDYLRQYQYRKQTKLGSPESDPQPGSKAEKMKKHLLAQPRVRTFIQPAPGFSKSVPLDVNLNRYPLQFPRNTYIEVPQQVAEVIGESLEQAEAAISRGQIGGDKEKEAALL